MAGGFVIPALLGAEIRFEADAAPQPLPCHLSLEQLERLEVPDWRNLWPMTRADRLVGRAGSRSTATWSAT